MVPELHRIDPPAAELADCYRTVRGRTVQASYCHSSREGGRPIAGQWRTSVPGSADGGGRSDESHRPWSVSRAAFSPPDGSPFGSLDAQRAEPLGGPSGVPPGRGVEAMGIEPTNLLHAMQALYQLSYAPRWPRQATRGSVRSGD